MFWKDNGGWHSIDRIPIECRLVFEKSQWRLEREPTVRQARASTGQPYKRDGHPINKLALTDNHGVHQNQRVVPGHHLCPLLK